MFTHTKTASSSRTVVFASVVRSPMATRTTASAVVKMIATHGVRRSRWTRPSGRGTMPCCAIPQISRDAMIRLMSAPLVSANSAIAENTFVFMASGPT
jgi:hypothetical protein